MSTRESIVVGDVCDSKRWRSEIWIIRTAFNLSEDQAPQPSAALINGQHIISYLPVPARLVKTYSLQLTEEFEPPVGQVDVGDPHHFRGIWSVPNLLTQLVHNDRTRSHSSRKRSVDSNQIAIVDLNGVCDLLQAPRAANAVLAQSLRTDPARVFSESRRHYAATAPQGGLLAPVPPVPPHAGPVPKPATRSALSIESCTGLVAAVANTATTTRGANIRRDVGGHEPDAVTATEMSRLASRPTVSVSAPPPSNPPQGGAVSRRHVGRVRCSGPARFWQGPVGTE